MEIEWFCPKTGCHWWSNEEALKDVEYPAEFLVRKYGIHCPKCKTRLVSREAIWVNYRSPVCDKPRKSVAMGVRPEDIPKAMKKWPGSRYDKTGALEISGRAEKKVRMKQRGYIEY